MSKKKNTTVDFKGYILVKCEPLSDQWECEFDRTVLAYSEEYPETPHSKGRSEEGDHYDNCYYEVYGVRRSDGRAICVQEASY